MAMTTQLGVTKRKPLREDYGTILDAQAMFLPSILANKKQEEYNQAVLDQRDKEFAQNVAFAETQLNQQQEIADAQKLQQQEVLEQNKADQDRANKLGIANLGLNAYMGYQKNKALTDIIGTKQTPVQTSLWDTTKSGFGDSLTSWNPYISGSVGAAGSQALGYKKEKGALAGGILGGLTSGLSGGSVFDVISSGIIGGIGGWL